MCTLAMSAQMIAPAPPTINPQANPVRLPLVCANGTGLPASGAATYDQASR